MRSIWKGALSFGLVNIPIRLYTGSHEKELSFVMLHKKDLGEIRYSRICKTDGEEVPWKDIVKGYEYQKGDYVVMTEEDFKKASPKKSDSIEITSFAEESEIDPIYYDKPYFLEPDKAAAKSYALLREALKKSGKVGIATYILHNHQRIGVIKPHQNVLVLNQLRYPAELVNPKDLEISSDSKISAAEMEMAIKLIKQLTSKFKPEKYHDTYVDELLKLIEQKAKGKKIVHKGKEEVRPTTKVHDIMSLLKASLDQSPKKKRSKVA